MSKLVKRVKREGKVSKHQRKHKGHKIYNPRVTLTGPWLVKYGFDIDEHYNVYAEIDTDGKRSITLIPKEDDE
jgi:hypothetical protein